MNLRGPADAERFRVTKYNDTHYAYRDPLPSCDIAPATDDTWPGFSRVKKAWSKEFSKRLETGVTVPLDAWRCATFTVDNLGTVRSLQRDAAIELIATAARRDLHRAAQRGTAIHSVLEDMAAGREPQRELDMEAAPYFDACKAFVDDVQPEFLFTEYVSISRTLGVAGTGDSTIRCELPGVGTVIASVDYKTRGADAKHAAYPEEACQVALHARPDYYIVASTNGNAMRVRPPDVDLGLIVSIRPDGYELFPIDLNDSYEALAHLVRSFTAKQTGQSLGRRSIGNSLHISRSSRTATKRAYLQRRVERLNDASPDALGILAAQWPAEVPTLPQSDTHTDIELTAIQRAIEQVEARYKLAFVPTDPAEGLVVLDAERMVARLRALPPDLLAVVEAAAKQADPPVPNLRSAQVRREHLDALEQVVGPLEAEHAQRRAQIRQAIAEAVDPDDAELIDALAAHVSDGARGIDRLTEADVERLAETCGALARGELVFVAVDDGWVIEERQGAVA